MRKSEENACDEKWKRPEGVCLSPRAGSLALLENLLEKLGDPCGAPDSGVSNGYSDGLERLGGAVDLADQGGDSVELRGNLLKLGPPR